MKKIVFMILVICLCFLVGCSNKIEVGFEEHYEEKPLIYMGLRYDKENIKKDELKLELAFGWEEYSNLEVFSKNSLYEFKGVVVSTTYLYLQSGSFGYVEVEKDGSLYFNDMYNVIYIDENECKDEKYLVEISGFRKPNYNYITEYVIDKTVFKNNIAGYIYINVALLMYDKTEEKYYFEYVNQKDVFFEVNEEGYVEAFLGMMQVR